MPSIFEPLKHVKKPHQVPLSPEVSSSLRKRIQKVAQQLVAKRQTVSAATLLILAAWLWLDYEPIHPVSQPVQQTLTLPSPAQLASQAMHEKPVPKTTPAPVIVESVKATLEKNSVPAYALNEVNQKAIEMALAGQASKATIALEQALLNDPQAGVVFDNLRRLYAGFASQSYQLALEPSKPKPVTVELASSDRDIQVQLEMPKTAPEAVKLTPPTSVINIPVQASPEPERVEKTNLETPSVEAPKVETLADIEPKAPPAPIVANPAPVIVHKEPTPAQKEAAQRKASQLAVSQSIKQWSEAWSKQDVKGYFASYAPNYAPKNSTRKAWMDYRQDRILAPKRIKVELSDVKIDLVKPNLAKVSFIQTYTSDTLTARNTKNLELERLNNTWLIIFESGR